MLFFFEAINLSVKLNITIDPINKLHPNIRATIFIDEFINPLLLIILKEASKLLEVLAIE